MTVHSEVEEVEADFRTFDPRKLTPIFRLSVHVRCRSSYEAVSPYRVRMVCNALQVTRIQFLRGLVASVYMRPFYSAFEDQHAFDFALETSWAQNKPLLNPPHIESGLEVMIRLPSLLQHRPTRVFLYQWAGLRQWRMRLPL